MSRRRRRRCRCRRRWRRRRRRRCRRLPKKFLNNDFNSQTQSLFFHQKSASWLELGWREAHRAKYAKIIKSYCLLRWSCISFSMDQPLDVWQSYLVVTFRVGPMNPIAFQPYLIEVTFKVPWNERLKTGRYCVILGIQVSYTARQNRGLSTTPASE